MILVVDDDLAILESVTDLLLLSGYEARATKNGLEALEVLEAELPDLIVADIMMPKMDGYELLERVRANPDWAHIPVIILTARGRSPEELRESGVDADEFVIKPFEPEDFLAVIERFIG